MFTNLIESASHRKDFKRRGSFFIAVVAAYSFIFLGAGIASIYAYDAHLEAQNTDLLVDYWLPPVKPVTEPEGPRASRAVRRQVRSNAQVDPNVSIPQRTAGVAQPDDPTKIPEKVGTEASIVPPVTGEFQISTKNVNPPSLPEKTEPGCTNCSGTTPAVAVEKPAPPVTPPVKTTLNRSTGVLRSMAIDLPQPRYPSIAKQIRAQGPVNVQILIDESGKVISAQAISGNAMLTTAAVEAARRARFTPTMLNNQPVKVQGVITYNFVLQ